MTEQIATKKGTTETIIPTFDAIVYKKGQCFQTRNKVTQRVLLI